MLVVGTAAAWWTAEAGLMEWHAYAGCAVLGLLLFRVYWGFFGSATARFGSFVRGPREVLTYARSLTARHPSYWPGHNPVSGLGVLALLGLLTAHVGLGLFAVDVDGLDSGPLSRYVSFDTGRSAARAHGLTFDLLCAMVALHVGAVLFYLWYKRENLILPMLSGRRRMPSAGAPVALLRVSAWTALPGIAIATLIVWLVMR
jgi:cytochrome b